MKKDWLDTVAQLLNAHSSSLRVLADISGIPPQLLYRGVNFRGADLREQDLTDLDLSGANLSHALLTPLQRLELEPNFDTEGRKSDASIYISLIVEEFQENSTKEERRLDELFEIAIEEGREFGASSCARLISWAGENSNSPKRLIDTVLTVMSELSIRPNSEIFKVLDAGGWFPEDKTPSLPSLVPTAKFYTPWVKSSSSFAQAMNRLQILRDMGQTSDFSRAIEAVLEKSVGSPREMEALFSLISKRKLSLPKSSAKALANALRGKDAATTFMKFPIDVEVKKEFAEATISTDSSREFLALGFRAGAFNSIRLLKHWVDKSDEFPSPLINADFVLKYRPELAEELLVWLANRGIEPSWRKKLNQLAKKYCSRNFQTTFRAILQKK